MIGIESMDNSQAASAFKLNKTAEDAQEQRNPLVSNDKDGDTVHISAEAMDLFKSKMDEFGTKDPSKLTEDQKADLKDTMESFADSKGLTREEMPHPGGMPPEDKDSDSPGGEGGNPPAGGPPSGGAKAAGGKGSASTEESSDVEDKEDEIEDLESEIEQLRSQANTDEEAADKLKTKETELAALEAELALLQQEYGS